MHVDTKINGHVYECKACICIWETNYDFQMPSKIILARHGNVFTRSCLVIPEKLLVLCGTRDGNIQLWDLVTIHPKDRNSYCEKNNGLAYYTTPYFETDFSSKNFDTFHSTIHTSAVTQLTILPHGIYEKYNQRDYNGCSRMLLIASLDEDDITIIW